MLNLSFIYDDAIQALSTYPERLAIAPLPAAVCMMQLDVINHFQYALQHYFTLSLDEPYLQNSSIGTPYQKWAYFTNEDFAMLSFAVGNLLRYTSRLIHETEMAALTEQRRFAQRKDKSNTYTSPICEISYRRKAIGLRVQDDQRLSITAVRTEPSTERVLARGTRGGPILYFRITTDDRGHDREQPISKEEYWQTVATLQTDTVDISNRSQLEVLRDRGEKELVSLKELNRAFAQVCRSFYQGRDVVAPFSNLNEGYWIVPAEGSDRNGPAD